MSIEGQGHFFTIYFPGFVCFVLYLAKISGERLQDHWSSGYLFISFRQPKIFEKLPKSEWGGYLAIESHLIDPSFKFGWNLKGKKIISCAPVNQATDERAPVPK